MPSLATLAYWELMILLSGFFGIVFWKLLTRQIKLNGLLEGDQPDEKTHFSPGRVQLLIFTALFAVNYLAQVIRNPAEFPPVAEAWLAVLGGSSAVYAGGKAQSLLFPGLGNSTRRSP